MEFNIPASIQLYWSETGIKPTTEIELAHVESMLGLQLPPIYASFMRQYGCVNFDLGGLSCFEYRYREAEQEVVRDQSVGHIKRLSVALKYYTGWQDDEGVQFPSDLFPFAMDLGQGELLVELGKHTERIYYWDFDDHDWENELVRLHYVSKDLVEFIHSLKVWDGW